MARVGGGRGQGWVWPLIIVLVLVGMALLAWAFLAPPMNQSTQPASEQPAAAPVDSSLASINDITAQPATYYGRGISFNGRLARTVGDMGLVVRSPGGESEMFALVNKPVAGTELHTGDFAGFTGTLREVNESELMALSELGRIDKPTMDALSQEKAYFSVERFAVAMTPNYDDGL